MSPAAASGSPGGPAGPLPSCHHTDHGQLRPAPQTMPGRAPRPTRPAPRRLAGPASGAPRRPAARPRLRRAWRALFYWCAMSTPRSSCFYVTKFVRLHELPKLPTLTGVFTRAYTAATHHGDRLRAAQPDRGGRAVERGAHPEPRRDRRAAVLKFATTGIIFTGRTETRALFESRTFVM
jgi:hypothetical protein